MKKKRNFTSKLQYITKLFYNLTFQAFLILAFLTQKVLSFNSSTVLFRFLNTTCRSLLLNQYIIASLNKAGFTIRHFDFMPGDPRLTQHSNEPIVYHGKKLFVQELKELFRYLDRSMRIKNHACYRIEGQSIGNQA